MSAGTKSDKANRLTPVESYQYDAGGRRIATTSGTNVVRHVYDGMHVVADTDVDGNLLRSYTWGPGIDKLLSVIVYGPTATNTFNALTDHLGTVHALVDENGDTVESYRYDAWGNVMGVFDGNGGSLPSSVLGLRYLFQGREYSWATHAAWGGAGLYNFRARYYDPLTGRWLSNDPIGISGGLNQYAFCANNPVMFVDPEGLSNSLGDLKNVYINGKLSGSVSITAVLGVGLQVNLTTHGIDLLPARGVGFGVAGQVDSQLPQSQPMGTTTVNVGVGPGGLSQTTAGVDVATGTIVGFSPSLSYGPRYGFWETRWGQGYGRHLSWCSILVTVHDTLHPFLEFISGFRLPPG